MNGLRKRWDRGPRTTIQGRDQSGREVTLRGKKGGPVIKQEVVLVIEPRATRP